MKDKAESLKGSTLDNRGWQQGQGKKGEREELGSVAWARIKNVATVLYAKVVALLFEFPWLFRASVAAKVFWPLWHFALFSLILFTSSHPFVLNPLYNFYACHLLLCSWTCVSVCVSVCLKNRRANSSMGLACPPPLSSSQFTVHPHLRPLLPLVCQSFTVWLANLLWKLICT